MKELQHDHIGPFTRAFEIVWLLVAAGLLVGNIVRLFEAGALTQWWAPLVMVAGAFCADFGSGIVHWTADTWGRETLPVFGRRFLRSFRVHHFNPDDFLRRDVIDCNGDVAMLNIPILAGAWLISLSAAGGMIAAVCLVSFSAVALPTSQVHQWAHMPAPPVFVRWLQRRGIILSREDHARHHREPYVVNYCITTGWCNRWLTEVGFFPIVERAITALTGLEPRSDEKRFLVTLQSGRTGENLVALEDSTPCGSGETLRYNCNRKHL